MHGVSGDIAQLFLIPILLQEHGDLDDCDPLQGDGYLAILMTGALFLFLLVKKDVFCVRKSYCSRE